MNIVTGKRAGYNEAMTLEENGRLMIRENMALFLPEASDGTLVFPGQKGGVDFSDLQAGLCACVLIRMPGVGLWAVHFAPIAAVSNQNYLNPLQVAGLSSGQYRLTESEVSGAVSRMLSTAQSWRSGPMTAYLIGHEREEYEGFLGTIAAALKDSRVDVTARRVAQYSTGILLSNDPNLGWVAEVSGSLGVLFRVHI